MCEVRSDVRALFILSPFARLGVAAAGRAGAGGVGVWA